MSVNVLLINKMEKVLNFTYNNPSSPAFMAGASAVYHEARKTLPKLTLNKILFKKRPFCFQRVGLELFGL